MSRTDCLQKPGTTSEPSPEVQGGHISLVGFAVDGLRAPYCYRAYRARLGSLGSSVYAGELGAKASIHRFSCGSLDGSSPAPKHPLTARSRLDSTTSAARSAERKGANLGHDDDV